MTLPTDAFVDLPGRLRLHYRDWGGDGPPLVLLHGLASNARIWDLTAPLLAERFRVVALDQRGHGLSDKPDEGYDFETITGDLQAFVDALGLERPALGGHSWGGNVVLQYAADRPGQVAWLALVDGGFLEISAFPGFTWERALAMMSPPKLAGMQLAAFLTGAKAWSGLGDLWSDDVQAIVLANFHIDGDSRIYPHLKRENHLKILRSMWEQRPSELWQKLTCPALLLPTVREESDPRSAIWLEQKREAVVQAEERVTAPAGVSVMWMHDSIHDVPLQRPEALAEAIAGFADALAR